MSTLRRVPRRALSSTDLALVAAFAALVAVCSYLGAIPVGGAGVPITLQTFAVMLTGCVLGPVRGLLAMLLYLALGAVGLPVFAEHAGGLGSFTGPTAGYLWSFAPAAAVCGALTKYVARARRTNAIAVFLCAAAGTVLVIHPLGILGLKLHLGVTFTKAAAIDGPYWLGDLVKTLFVALIAAEVHRAFPRLLARTPAGAQPVDPAAAGD